MQIKMRHIRRTFGLLLTLSLIMVSNGFTATMNPTLSSLQAEGADPDSIVEILLFMDDSSDLPELTASGTDRFVSRSDRIRKTNQKLRSFEHPKAASVESALTRYASSEITRYWIVPAYSLSVKVSSLDELSTIPGVGAIVENAHVIYEPPVVSSPALALATGASSELQSMNVPALWARGYTGAGRLVASFDTGVEGTHPALASKWRGQRATLEESWFSKVRPESNPIDLIGHGTHTMGIMVGSVGADSFGVAPDAEWISAGVIDQGKSLGATFADILEAYQWALNPDGDLSTTADVPDVILNSWGIPAGMFNPCDNMFWGAIDVIEAAGIVTIFAAGNEGPGPSTIRSPADRATTGLNTFSVGAVAPNMVVANFSSHGPSSCDPSEIKPEVVAPGVGIRSSTKGGIYLNMSGTSMAAPYIAGLVALARQYNPDATPAEIKQAMIRSTKDLGDEGEDNSYGHGFVDAVRMLDNLPKPINPDYKITETILLDSVQPMPGDAVQVQVVLANEAGLRSGLYGRLIADDDSWAELLVERVAFIPLGNGTEAVTLTPFVLLLDEALPHGFLVSFELSIETSEGELIETLELSFEAGIAPPGDIGTHAMGGVTLSISDYGQLGLAAGSIYNAGGEGLRFNGSDNLLYEAGIFIGRRGYDLSSAIRGVDGDFTPSDFSPTRSIATEFTSSSSGSRLSAWFSDSSNDRPLPIEIGLTSIDLSQNFQESIVILSYKLVNQGDEELDSVYFGFEADFDLFGETESLNYSDNLNMIYQLSPSSPAVGIVMLNNLASASVVINGSGKSGLKDADKLSLISSPEIRLEARLADDLYFILGSKALTIASGDTARVAMALVMGNDLDELEANAQAALIHYRRLGLGTPGNVLPEDYTLNQNYPNPFNPSTTISFTLLKRASVTLDLYNVLGQTIVTLQEGELAAGNHEFEWNGRNSNGSEVASGVYFYRLRVGSKSQAKKMVLLR